MSHTLYCPVCEHGVQAFLPLPSYYEQKWREHGFIEADHEPETLNKRAYSCPRCGASDRDRLCTLYLKQALPRFQKETRLIDFAPSTPLATWVRRNFAGEYRAADLYMEGVDDRVDITQMNVYADESVDVFICSHVLEHVPDDAAAARELHRILKPGGFGLVLAPIDIRLDDTFEDGSQVLAESDRWRLYGQGDHVRYYSKKGFVNRMRQASFKVAEFGVGHFSQGVFDRCGIATASVLYVVAKS